LGAYEQEEGRWTLFHLSLDRLLHDTVLATLTVLAHEGVGVAPGEIRAACARDLGVLTGSGQSGRNVVIASPGPVGFGLEHRISVEQIVGTVTTHATALGLNLRAHLGSLERQEVRLDPLVASALREALAECVTNVRLHAGVDRLDLVASVTGGALVVLVERLSSVGGNAAVWSRPDHGTSVKLRLPLPTATS
jgi:hypothetical protein